MAWIRTISEEEAKGSVKEQYEEAKRRAGWVWNVIKISSLKPDLMDASMAIYLASFHRPSARLNTPPETMMFIVGFTPISRI